MRRVGRSVTTPSTYELLKVVAPGRMKIKELDWNFIGAAHIFVFNFSMGLLWPSSCPSDLGWHIRPSCIGISLPQNAVHSP